MGKAPSTNWSQICKGTQPPYHYTLSRDLVKCKRENNQTEKSETKKTNKLLISAALDFHVRSRIIQNIMFTVPTSLSP